MGKMGSLGGCQFPCPPPAHPTPDGLQHTSPGPHGPAVECLVWLLYAKGHASANQVCFCQGPGVRSYRCTGKQSRGVGPCKCTGRRPCKCFHKQANLHKVGPWANVSEQSPLRTLPCWGKCGEAFLCFQAMFPLTWVAVKSKATSNRYDFSRDRCARRMSSGSSIGSMRTTICKCPPREECTVTWSLHSLETSPGTMCSLGWVLERLSLSDNQ